MINNLSILVFTNEKSFNINYITIPQLLKNISHIDIKINLVSNRFPETDRFDGVNYIETNVPFQGNGGHFRESMMCALKEIKDDYILFLCDDYIFKSPIKKEKFESLVPIMIEDNIDFLSLQSLKHMGGFINKWNHINTDVTKYGFIDKCFYEMPDNYLHLFSVQAGIWKKSSLIELLDFNQYLELHALDSTNIKNKKGEYRERDPLVPFYHQKEEFFDYRFKCVGVYLDPISFGADERNIGGDYLVLDYCEVIRHGKIVEYLTNSRQYFLDLIETDDYKKIKHKLENFY